MGVANASPPAAARRLRTPTPQTFTMAARRLRTPDAATGRRARQLVGPLLPGRRRVPAVPGLRLGQVALILGADVVALLLDLGLFVGAILVLVLVLAVLVAVVLGFLLARIDRTMFGDECAVTNWRMAVSEQARSACSSQGWLGLGSVLVQLTVTNPFGPGRGPCSMSCRTAHPGRQAPMPSTTRTIRSRRIVVVFREWMKLPSAEC